MITRRLLTAFIVVAVGFLSVFLLPKSMKSSPAGIAMELPIFVGNWMGEDSEVTPRELEVLAKDTQFARKMYRNHEGDEIYVSIVMSGDDMTNSIHRPERCLPAQGWTLQGSEARSVQIAGGKPLQVTRLNNARVLHDTDQHEFTLHNLNYYWFVGYNDITASHIQRTAFDLRDRVLYGYNQRWAYVTVTSHVTKGIRGRPQRDEAETGEMLERFIAELGPKLHRPDGARLL